MGRIGDTFARLRSDHKKAVVVYLTAGDPDVESSVEGACAALEAGADILEVGVPFSDPIADGPTIQRAMKRALDAGGGMQPALGVVAKVREKSSAPIVLFGYFNPLLWYGVDKICEQIADAGADGLLVVDLPHEEDEEIREAALRSGLDWIALVAPTTGAERVQKIATRASGFIYVISTTGVTGGRLVQMDGVESTIAQVRRASGLPACVGFGIRDAETAARAAGVGDGVVVGSAVVEALEAGSTAAQRVSNVKRLVRSLRTGVDEVR